LKIYEYLEQLLIEIYSSPHHVQCWALEPQELWVAVGSANLAVVMSPHKSARVAGRLDMLREHMFECTNPVDFLQFFRTSTQQLFLAIGILAHFYSQ
jgi:hypothetical protein